MRKQLTPWATEPETCLPFPSGPFLARISLPSGPSTCAAATGIRAFLSSPEFLLHSQDVILAVQGIVTWSFHRCYYCLPAELVSCGPRRWIICISVLVSGTQGALKTVELSVATCM